MPDPREQLRRAVSDLPGHTRVAMLEALRTEQIIAGAYTDGRGGVCPLLAAHRLGGRANAEGFAAAWDAYMGAKKRPRSATDEQLGELRQMLLERYLEDELRPCRPRPPVEAPLARAETVDDRGKPAGGEAWGHDPIGQAPPAGEAHAAMPAPARAELPDLGDPVVMLGRFKNRTRVRALAKTLQSVESVAVGATTLAVVPMALGAGRLLHQAQGGRAL